MNHEEILTRAQSAVEKYNGTVKQLTMTTDRRKEMLADALVRLSGGEELDHEQYELVAQAVNDALRGPEQSEGDVWFRECAIALNQGDEEAALEIIEQAEKDPGVLKVIDTRYVINNDGEFVILFDDGSWFDVGVCWDTQLFEKKSGREAA
jgi:hypothetical protein